MVTGDLVYLLVCRNTLEDIVMANTGGQTWTVGTLRQTGASSCKVYWCRFNGTWTNNPSIAIGSFSIRVISLYMAVFRPSVGSNTWAVDVAEGWHTYSSPVSPFDVTATGRTTIAGSTVTIASWEVNNQATWALQTAGWTNAGNAQYRNTDPSSPSRPISLSSVYKTLSSPAATGNPVNRQLTNQQAGLWIVNTFKEQSAAVTVATAGDGVFHDTESGVVVTGTGFGASQGAGSVIISPSNNIADAGAVTQTISSWADTSITLSALGLSTFSYFTNLFLFVKNSGGQSNASGFVVQREAWLNVAAVLKNLAGTAQANLTNLRYRITAVTINGTVLLSNTNGTTDGSGNLALGPYVLTSGGPINPGDDVWITLALDGASQAVSYATCVKVTPTYT